MKKKVFAKIKQQTGATYLQTWDAIISQKNYFYDRF